MTGPLNPTLYNALVARYGEVRISNPGQPYLVQQQVNPYRSAGYLNVCVDPGEYYVICCPQCGDTRFRLYINHRYCTIEGTKLFGRHLIHCFNEGCELPNFYKIVYEPRKYPRAASVMAPPEALEIKSVTMPGRCVPLDQLPADHPAIRYITVDRKTPAGGPAPFDPVVLSRDWGVCYCEHAERGAGYAPELVEGRIVIPVCWEGKLIGWQARGIHPGANPKYYTMPGLPKQRILFNGDRAKTQLFGVIVEGVFDCFAAGITSVATLGHKLSWAQRELLSKWFGNGAVALIYDPEEVQDIELNLHLMKGMFKEGIFSVPIAAGWDPGCLPTEFLWSLIRDAAAKAGVRIPA